MKTSKTIIKRRGLLLGSMIAGFSLSARLADSAVPTGIDALDTASLYVREPAEVLLVAITMIGHRLVAVGEHGIIIWSDDNGVTWTQAQVPVDVTLTCVGFTTQQIGWAAGHFGVILKTIDGGKSWQVQLNGIQANQLTAAAAQDPSLLQNPSPAAALAVARAARFNSEGPDKPFLTLLPLDTQKIIVFGAYRMTMFSKTGGVDWADWSLNIYDRYSNNIYDAVQIGGAYYLVGEVGLIFRSTDDCNSFLPMTPASDVTLFGVLGARDGGIITYGVAGTCFRSSDGCKSWTSVQIASQNNLTAGRVLRSGAILLGGEDGMIWRSVDNGMTFSPVSNVKQIPIFDFEEASNGDLVIVGPSGVRTVPADILNS